MITPIKFEIAKLLKEKGFDLNPNRHLVRKTSKMGFGKEFIIDRNLDYDDLYLEYVEKNIPTIAEVVMWLYEKHGIWIGVELTDNTLEFYFQPTIWTSKDRDYSDEDMIDQAKSICKWKEWRYDSSKEAYEAAIEYTLNKLI